MNLSIAKIFPPWFPGIFVNNSSLMYFLRLNGTEANVDWLTEVGLAVFVILLSIFALTPAPIHAHSRLLLLTPARADARISTGK